MKSDKESNESLILDAVVHKLIAAILRSDYPFNKINKFVLKCRLSEWTIVPHQLNARIVIK